MSNYKVKDYINKKWEDIAKDTPMMKAYNLGLAIGLLETYKSFLTQFGADKANKIYEPLLCSNDELSTVFGTMVGLYNDDTNTKANLLFEELENFKKPSLKMTDEHSDLIEKFIEFLHEKTE